MEFEIVEKEALHFVGIAVRVEEPENASLWIGALWDRFYREWITTKIPNKKGELEYGVYFDYEKDSKHPYTFLAGCEVSSLDDVPKGMVAHSVPKDSYAHFEIIGTFPDKLIQTWQELEKYDLKRSFKTDFECYGPKFQTPPPQVDLFVGIC